MPRVFVNQAIAAALVRGMLAESQECGREPGKAPKAEGKLRQESGPKMPTVSLRSVVNPLPLS